MLVKLLPSTNIQSSSAAQQELVLLSSFLISVCQVEAALSQSWLLAGVCVHVHVRVRMMRAFSTRQRPVEEVSPEQQVCLKPDSNTHRHPTNFKFPRLRRFSPNAKAEYEKPLTKRKKRTFSPLLLGLV